MTDVGTHFEAQYADYVNSIKKTNKEWYRNINRELNRFLSGTVLDIGNGGVFTYDISRPGRIIAADIAFKDIGKLPKHDKVLYLCDDARSLRSVRDNTADAVLIQFVLHHIAGISANETLKDVRQVIRTSRRVLKPGGFLIIIETCAPRFAEVSERMLYPITSRLLRFLRKPMIFLLSRKTLLRLLRDSGFSEVHHKKISFGKRFDVLNGLKPGLVVIPGWMSPHRCYMLVGKK